MRIRTRWSIAVVAAAVPWLVACGGDANDDVAPETTAGAEVLPAEDDGTVDDPQPPAGGPTDAILLATVGITPGDLGISDDQVACMDDEIAAALPDGLPDDLPSSEEAADALDAAATACGVSLR
ncbi:MAG: hypothetical protein AAGA17_02795 [Actinomycetota bacterium]